MLVVRLLLGMLVLLALLLGPGLMLLLIAVKVLAAIFPLLVVMGVVGWLLEQ